jgi:hypothetical protein
MSLPSEKVELLEKSKMNLDNITDHLKELGINLAIAEKEYRKALAVKEISLKSRGNNYPSNMALDIAKGTPEIAELRYKRDIAKINYEVCKDKLKNERMNSEILRSLLAYDRANYLNT